MNGPDSGLIPVDVGGEKWLLGSVCERGNCGDHYLKILYIPSEHVIAGFITTAERKTCLAMSGAEARILRRDVPDVTPVQQAPAMPTTPADNSPADTIWAFKGDGGKSLWQVCGGQSNSCTIIANTKYYVAVLNHKSATGCAFGDFMLPPAIPHHGGSTIPAPAARMHISAKAASTTVSICPSILVSTGCW